MATPKLVGAPVELRFLLGTKKGEERDDSRGEWIRMGTGRLQREDKLRGGKQDMARRACTPLPSVASSWQEVEDAPALPYGLGWARCQVGRGGLVGPKPGGASPFFFFFFSLSVILLIIFPIIAPALRHHDVRGALPVGPCCQWERGFFPC